MFRHVWSTRIGVLAPLPPRMNIAHIGETRVN